jgi:hypothetical protein
MQPSFKTRTSLIVITSDMQSGWLAQLISLRRHGILPTVLLLDPISFGGMTGTRGVLAALADLEIAHYVVTREVLDRPEAHPGLRGHWDWQVTPLGRVIPRRVARDAAWRSLA